MPMGDADGLLSIAALYRAADDPEALDNLSKMRLHDFELKPLCRLCASKAAGYSKVLVDWLASLVRSKGSYSQMRCLPNLLPGGLTPLRLHLSATFPRTHVLPWCIGVLPVNFALSDAPVRRRARSRGPPPRAGVRAWL